MAGRTRGSGGAAAAATGGTAAGTVAAIPAAPTPFSLYPSRATAGVLSYSDPANVKIYKVEMFENQNKNSIVC